MKIIKDKNIAIIGGGPGGLTLARLLQMQGANVTVYERDVNRTARVQGATLDLHEESGLKAIKEAGLMKAFIANYRPGADRVRIMDKYANIVLEDTEKDESEVSRPEIDRGPLREILLDSLLPGTIVWNSQLLSLVHQSEGWVFNFQDGTSATADLVIGADGANSKIRPYITSIKPFYSGVTVIEGTVYNSVTACPTVHQLVNGGKIFAMGDDKTLIVSSKGDGSLSFYTGCKVDEFWGKESSIDFSNRAQIINWFKQEYAGWSAIWLELFENAAMPLWYRPQYCMPLDQTWEALPDITMLGDAAHLMPPYAGEGVNMAMLDALELSECLTSEQYPDLQSAIAAYEQQMRKRASATAADTLESTAILHSPAAIPFISNIIN